MVGRRILDHWLTVDCLVYRGCLIIPEGRVVGRESVSQPRDETRKRTLSCIEGRIKRLGEEEVEEKKPILIKSSQLLFWY